MALSKNINFNGNMYVQGQSGNLVLINNNYNTSITNAYIKILNLTGDKNRIHLEIGILDKKDGTLIYTDSYEFIPDLSDTSSNFLKQGYEQLKANKYTDAIDLLDE